MCYNYIIFCKPILRVTTGVDFTNVLLAAFFHQIQKSQKDTDELTVFFLALLESAHVRAVHKMLVALTHDEIIFV